jgi:hypothetical protein
MSSFTIKRVTFDSNTKKNDGLSSKNAAFDYIINGCLCEGKTFSKMLKKLKNHKSIVLKRTIIWLEGYFELAKRYPSGMIYGDVAKKWKLPCLPSGGGNNISVGGDLQTFAVMTNLKKQVKLYALKHYSVKKIQTIFKKYAKQNVPLTVRFSKPRNSRIYLDIQNRKGLSIKNAVRYGASWDEDEQLWYVVKSRRLGGRLAILKYGIKRKPIDQILTERLRR